MSEALQIARIKSLQDDIKKAMSKGRKGPMSTPEVVLKHDQEQQSAVAEVLGVDPDEYRRWCAGEDLPHIRKAMMQAK